MFHMALICRVLAAVHLTFVMTSVAANAVTPAEVTLAHDGKATMGISISPQSGPSVRQSAQILSEYLEKITGAPFAVEEGDGSAGIVVGLLTDYPQHVNESRRTADDLRAQEEYRLVSHARGLLILGRTQEAVRHAIWDTLHRLGYRQFFPGKTWEVVPSETTLRMMVDEWQSPDYLHRRIGYGFGMWGYNIAPYEEWCERNRMPGAFSLSTGHAYGRIIRANQAAFKEHPEYYALVGGQRRGSKMCISNEAVQKLVVANAQWFFEKFPERDCFSIDPSDGGGWCECSSCSELGSPSNRALLLANRVSEHLEAKWPGKYVSLYAYNEHSPPPTIRARPRVIINVATAFLRGGQTTNQLLKEWREQGVQQLGIREYYSVNTWDRDLPGRANASDPAYLAQTISEFHERGAVFMIAEASDNWAPNGLGYYLASRFLWNTTETRRIDELKADFFEKAFGEAAQPMAEFYAAIDGRNRPLLSSPFIGQLYRLLRDARNRTNDARIHERLDHLALYVRYIELYQSFVSVSGEARQNAFEALIRHTYRMRTTMMVHTKALYRDLAARDPSVTIPEGARWNVPEERNPWKQNPPLTSEDIQAWVSDGIKNHPPLAFEPVAFTGKLIPAATALDLPSLPPLASNLSRGRITYYTWFDEAPATLQLQVTGGLISYYRDRGPVQLRLYAGLEDEATLVDHQEALNDGQTHTVALSARDKGLHVLTVSDGGDMTKIVFPPGQIRTVEMSMEHQTRFHHRSSFYFYVPKGTRVIGGFYRSSHGVLLHDPQGKRVGRVNKAGYFTFDVPEGMDGQPWSFQQAMGGVILMTVPPYVAGSPQELLLPETIVQKDRNP